MKNEIVAVAQDEVPSATEEVRAAQNEDAQDMDMEYNIEDAVEEHMDAEFTLDDVLAQDASQVDVAALHSAADEELSSIYAITKNKFGVEAEKSENEFDSPKTKSNEDKSLKDEDFKKQIEDEENIELSTRGWSSILGGSSRRDSLSLPSLTRRDSFSLLSNKHLRTSYTSLNTSTTSNEAQETEEILKKKNSESRRQSLAMEATQSDFGSIIEAAANEEKEALENASRVAQNDEEETINLTTSSRPSKRRSMVSKSRRTSLAMEMTHTDLGEIIRTEEVEETKTVRTSTFRTRRSSIMDMTMTDVGAILEQEPVDMDEEEAATKTIRFELSRDDMGLLLDTQGAEKINIRSSITFKNRRQSLAMEETVSNFGEILETEAADNATESNEVDTNLDESTNFMTTPLETAAERAAKPASNLLSLLSSSGPSTVASQSVATTTTSTQGPTRMMTRSRRQSLAMETTMSNFGEILQSDEPIAKSTTKSRRQSLAMDMTMTNIGEILSDDQSEVVESGMTSKSINAPKSRRQSLAMDMTISNLGEILEASDANISQTEEKEEEISNSKNRRQSMAMDMTISNLGEIMEQEEVPDIIVSSNAELPAVESFQKKSEESIPVEEMDIVTPEVTSTLIPTIEVIEEQLEDTVELEQAQQNENSTVSVPVEAPEIKSTEMEMEIEKEDTIELKDTNTIDSEENKEKISEQSPAVHSEQVETALPESDNKANVPSNAVSDVAMMHASVVEDDDILFSDVISITSSFPNLSMSLSSRNAIRKEMEKAISQVVADEPISEEKKTEISPVEPSEESNVQVSSNNQMIEQQSEFEPNIAEEHDEEMEEIQKLSKSRRSSVASRRSTARLSFLDVMDDHFDVDTGMDTAALDAYLQEDTQSLVQKARQEKRLRPVAAPRVSEIFAVLGEGGAGTSNNPMDIDDGAEFDENSDCDSLDNFDEESKESNYKNIGTNNNGHSAKPKAALFSALSKALPHRVSRQPFNASAAHELSIAMARENQKQKEMMQSQQSRVSSDSQTSSNQETDETLSSSFDLQGSNSNGSAQMDVDGLTDASSPQSPTADERSQQLDKVQRQFEAHMEQQLRTPGIRRKSLLAQSVMTPFVGASAAAGSDSPAQRKENETSFRRLSIASGRLSYGGIATPSATTTISMNTMTLSGLAALANSTSNSLSRFLSSFGVNFLDSMASRRQSLGIRVPEPRSDYDRMMTVMRSEPELELANRLFGSLTSFSTECEARIAELEQECKEQCIEKTGVFHLFTQCITARNGEARKDFSSLKQLALTEAKLRLNERYLGYFYEYQLNQTLQITLASAKSYLSQLQDQQATATFSASQRRLKLESAFDLPPKQQQQAASSSSSHSKSSNKDAVRDMEEKLSSAKEAESLAQVLLGWQLREATQSHLKYDFRNAVELTIDLSYEELDNASSGEEKADGNENTTILKIGDISLSTVMRVRTPEEESERNLVDFLLSGIEMSAYRGSTNLMWAVNEIATRVGRVLDLVVEIRLLSRTWFIEGIEQVPNVGAALFIRFSDFNSGKRFVSKLTLDASYPFVSGLNSETDLSFVPEISASQIEDIIEEEVSKSSFKLLTRLCKRLDRLCKA